MEAGENTDIPESLRHSTSAPARSLAILFPGQQGLFRNEPAKAQMESFLVKQLATKPLLVPFAFANSDHSQVPLVRDLHTGSDAH